MLILRERIPWEVECEKCKPYRNVDESVDRGVAFASEILIAGTCPTCHGTGTRRVTYEVEAEVRVGLGYTLERVWIEFSVEGAREKCEKTLEELAERLLEAHLAGEEMPGVTVKEARDVHDQSES